VNEESIRAAWRWYFFKRKLKSLSVYFLSFVCTFILAYFALTFDAQIVKVKYFFQNFGKKEEAKQILSPEIAKIAETSLYLPTIKEQVKESPLSELPDNYLMIPKINVKAPIIWNSETDEKSMLKNLQNGVAHYKGTSLPDENGNVFITGHSSYYRWDKGKYKTVFTLLPKLEKDDEIVLSYKNNVYIYKVYDKFVVKPEDVWVLQPTPEPTLTLMTCVPIGTNLKRLIIRARPVQPVLKEIKKEFKKEPFLELPDFLYP
jgi:LPXTG-site transpeptidase (sortase) family protein